MKVRIGISLSESVLDLDSPGRMLEFVDLCERWDVDSVWVSDHIVPPRPTLDPVVLLSYLGSHLRAMRFGTSALVLPTRQPVVLAKQLATLDFLCRGRLLVAAGLGADDSRDFQATGVEKKERGKRGDEAIVLMKKLWTEENVTFEGKFYSAKDLTLFPRPYQRTGIPLWVGGRSQAALRRAGRLADGWLTSNVSPAEAGAGIKAIRKYAAEVEREIPEDHYGVLLPFFFAPDRGDAMKMAASSIRRRPDIEPTDYAALGSAKDVEEKVREYVDVGVTKFVMRPTGPRELLPRQVEILAKEIIPVLQTPFSEAERQERLGGDNPDPKRST
jgi:probable F420-dependent oxidoreductase